MEGTFMLLVSAILVCIGAPPELSVPPMPGKVHQWQSAHTFTHKTNVTSVAFGPDIIAVGNQGGEIIVGHAQTGKKLEELLAGKENKQPIDRVQFSPDGQWLYFSTSDHNGMHKCHVDNKNRTFYSMNASSSRKVHGVSNDGSYWLITYPEAKKLFLVDVERLEEGILQLIPGGNIKYQEPITLVVGESDVVVGTTAKTILRFETGKKVPLWEKSLEKFKPTALALSVGGKTIALAGQNGEVRLYAADSGKAGATLTGHQGIVTSVAFSPNGEQIVTGSADKTARVWDVTTGKELAVLKGHSSAVTTVAFSPGGEMIVTGSDDKTARVWVAKP